MRSKRYTIFLDAEAEADNDVAMADLDVSVYSSTEISPVDHKVYARRFGASSRRNPIDKANVDAGALIALGRALEQAGKQLQTVGDHLVKHEEDKKAHKEEIEKSLKKK